MTTVFTDNQFDQAYPTGIEAHWWNLARNRIVLSTLKRFVCREDRVIEVGCGRGVVVGYLRECGFDCVGVELAAVAPLPEVREFVRSGTNVLHLDEDERQGYDVLLLLDVIEHIADPGPFLRELIDSFPSLRHILLTVPARAELWSNYDEHYGHFRRYDREQLAELAKGLPVKVLTFGYFFHSAYLLLRTLNLFKRARATTLHPPSGVFLWLHRLFAHGMVLDAALLPGSLPGSSLLAVLAVDRGGETGSRQTIFAGRFSVEEQVVE